MVREAGRRPWNWRRLVGRASGWLAVSFALLLTWGVIEPRVMLDRQTHDVVLPRLPAALDGTRVAVIADLQIGMWLTNRAMARRAVQQIAFPPATAPLAVAGHTHGGQVRLPFLPRWSWMMLAKDEPVRADGWIAGFGARGNRLYVNRGIGFSMLPVRINCPPELTVLTLRAPGRR